MMFLALLSLLVAVGAGALVRLAREADERVLLLGRLSYRAAAALAVVCALLACLTAVPAGHVGVPVVFGAVQPRPIPEGLHFVNPLADIQTLSVRTETYTMVSSDREGQVRGDDSVYALSSDGVLMAMDVSVSYKLVDASAPSMYRHIGRDYVNSIVRPAARSAVPEATARFAFQESYAARREELAAYVRTRMTERIGSLIGQYGDIPGPGIVIQQVFLRKIELPPNLKQSIEQKMQAEQEAQRMQFVLDRERREAERKRIEAQGIRDFQATVSEGISDRLLQWKGIEATEKIADSKNSKVIVIGNGKGSLPVILNAAQ